MALNATNERLKYRYLAHLRDARQFGEHSIDQATKALDRLKNIPVDAAESLASNRRCGTFPRSRPNAATGA